MEGSKISIILDTNILIRFMISKSYVKLDKHFERGSVELLFSDELLSEFLDVIKRPRL
jgi:hypothetical protein